MSLVDYSSDEEEEEEEEEEKEKHLPLPQQRTHIASSSVRTSVTTEIANLQAGFCRASTNLGETSLKLPDASQLLASFDSVKESLAVNIGGSAFTSAKRSDLNGSVDGPPKKISKGNLLPSRILPDTAGGLLLPPQLRGRSNVATEDLDKLFTKRQGPS